MTATALARRPLDLLLQMEDGGALTATSLILTDPEMPFDRYEAVGRWLGTLRDATAWWLGDWLIFGEGVYGEKYAQAVEATGRSKQTLKNYLWVASNVPASRRRDDLSWSHHAEVASLEPKQQRSWLTRAAREGWSIEEMRGQMRDPKPIEVMPDPERVIEIDADEAAEIAEALAATSTTPEREALYERIRAASAANGAVRLEVKQGRPCPTCGGSGVEEEQ